MAERAYTRHDVVRLIETGEIWSIGDIFFKCKYPIYRVAGAISSKPGRLRNLLYRPHDFTIREILRFAWYFDVHYLVVFRLIERQMEFEDMPRTMLIRSFRHVKEEYPVYLKDYLDQKKKPKGDQ